MNNPFLRNLLYLPSLNFRCRVHGEEGVLCRFVGKQLVCVPVQQGTSFSHTCKFQKCLPGWSKVVEGREGVPRVVSKQLVCRVGHGLCPCTHTRDTVTHPMHRKHGRCKHLFFYFLDALGELLSSSLWLNIAHVDMKVSLQ